MASERPEPWGAAWADPAYVLDPTIDHDDQRVHGVATMLHLHEQRRYHHEDGPAVTCILCARRATTAVRALDAAAP